ncbi:MAG: hypothetical protein OEY63_04250 [Gemmatimonadota bacterium]|nr:hypothetical protein [Gemmatimonadota bacterium]
MVGRIVVLLVFLGCGGSSEADQAPEPVSLPLPVGAMVGNPVTVYPITMVLADESLGWDPFFESRDSVLFLTEAAIERFLTERVPEVDWIYPERMRQAYARAPGMLSDPDRIATAMLRFEVDRVPDPLRSQMRTLTGVAGDRLALVPASLIFLPAADGVGRAELTVVLVDVRLGEIRWRTVSRGEGNDPMAALRVALGTLAPLGQ